MKCVPTLARTAALAAGAMILSTVFAVAPAHAVVTADICKQADTMADGVYDQALKSPHLYPTAADAAAAARAAYARRILAEHRGYSGDGRGVTDFPDAQSICRRLKAAPTGPWV